MLFDGLSEDTEIKQRIMYRPIKLFLLLRIKKKEKGFKKFNVPYSYHRRRCQIMKLGMFLHEKDSISSF